MSARTIATLNPPLTNFASGLAQDLASSLARFVAPDVEVPAGIGHYKLFDSKNAFQIYNTERALGGSATRIQFKATDPTFDCRPQALEVAIDDAEYSAAGDANATRLDESRIKTLVTSAALAHEDKVFTLCKTVTAVANKGNWTDSNVDPVAEIDEQIEILATATGLMPNRAVIGLGAWRILRNHPKIKARLSVAKVQSPGLGDFASMLLNPSLDLRLAVLSKDNAKFGADKNAVNILGSEFFLFLGANSPSAYDPSWIKCFVTRDGSVDAVRTYRDESARSTIHAVDWSEDIKIVGSACAKRLTIS